MTLLQLPVRKIQMFHWKDFLKKEKHSGLVGQLGEAKHMTKPTKSVREVSRTLSEKSPGNVSINLTGAPDQSRKIRKKRSRVGDVRVRKKRISD